MKETLGQADLFFVGSLEPLLVMRRRKRRRRPASLAVPRGANAGADDDDGDQDAIPEEGDDIGLDAMRWRIAWRVCGASTELETEMVGTRITPEEVERAIGAAFAIGAAA
jgi:hypothetical protein